MIALRTMALMPRHLPSLLAAAFCLLAPVSAHAEFRRIEIKILGMD
jgi:hypothetical protein